MAEQSAQSTTTATADPEGNRGENIFSSWRTYFNAVEQTMMDAATREQQVQQLNAVDDATLQAVLSSMTESETQAFLDELNKTGKACESTFSDRF